MNGSTRWLQCHPQSEPTHMRLFCLPHAGGGSSDFHSWNPSLPSAVQTCSVLLPGREMRFSETSYTELEPLVDAIHRELRPWLDTPFAVFGHSMGSLLAFEWVRRLQLDGCPMPAWLFLSGRRAPNGNDESSPLYSLPDAEFLEELNRVYRGIPEEFLRNPEIMEVFLPILRADIAVVESYRFRPAQPLDCPITVFAGAEDTSVSWEQLLAWKLQTRSRFAAHILPGGHFYPRAPLLKAISATLAELRSSGRT